MDGSIKSSEFLAKAEKWLGWCDTYLTELVTYADAHRTAEVERVFITLLSSIATVHEALYAAAQCAGLGNWAASLNAIRNQDPLLFYVWKARDSETHDALLKWTDTQSLSVRVVDDQAYFQTTALFYRDRSDEAMNSRLMLYIYEAHDKKELSAKMKAMFRPSEERLRQAGVELIHNRASFMLQPFSYRKKSTGKKAEVAPPDQHLGKLLPQVAEYVMERAVSFYRLKHSELRADLDRLAASRERFPQAPAP